MCVHLCLWGLSAANYSLYAMDSEYEVGLASELDKSFGARYHSWILERPESLWAGYGKGQEVSNSSQSDCGLWRLIERWFVHVCTHAQGRGAKSIPAATVLVSEPHCSRDLCVCVSVPLLLYAKQSGLYQQTERGCSLRGFYVQVPATAETEIQRLILGRLGV